MEFLENTSNGLLLFLGTLALYGIREKNSRSLETEEPFSLLTPNIKERPKSALDSYFFFGSYNWDGSQLYIDTSNNHVYLAKIYTLEKLYEWSSFEEFIDTEIPRICSLFDDNGDGMGLQMDGRELRLLLTDHLDWNDEKRVLVYFLSILIMTIHLSIKI